MVTSASQNDPLSTFLRPPAGSLAKLGYYSARYGLVHAICSYIGRKYFHFWFWVGPVVTRRHLRRWLAGPGPHVLNLGGGSLLSLRWLTADVDPRSDVFMNVTEPLPMPDNALDVVYSEEVIEHIDREAGGRMLAECFRVLKPEGTLRLTTPSTATKKFRDIMGALTPHPGPLPVEGRGSRAAAAWSMGRRPPRSHVLGGSGPCTATRRPLRGSAAQATGVASTRPLSPQRGEGRGEG